MSSPTNKSSAENTMLLPNTIPASNTSTTKRYAPNDFNGEPASAPNPKRSCPPPINDCDTIDPVEKLLSLTNVNYDFLADIDNESYTHGGDYTFSDSNKSHSCSSIDACCDQSYSDSSLETCQSIDDESSIKLPNFTQILNENLRKHYLRSTRDTYRSKFSVLNPSSASSLCESTSAAPSTPVTQQAPFFRTVNFNPAPSKSRGLEEFVLYDDDTPGNDDDESVGPTSPLNSVAKAGSFAVPSKMSFHYRHGSNNNLNLTQPCFKNRSNDKYEDNYDVQKVLNTCLLSSGKGNEMFGSSKFLINDFLL